MLPFDFGGRLAIHPGEALYIVGYSRTLEGAKKTARNLMSRNAYPLPITLVARQRRVLVSDVLRAVGIGETGSSSSQALAPLQDPVAVKRGPGRPRKTAQIRAVDHGQ